MGTAARGCRQGACLHAQPGNYSWKYQRGVFVPYCHLLRKADAILKSDILIDINGRACLAGLYPLMRTSDELTVVPSDSYNTAKLGDNERWPAPEILEGRKVGKAADIFSFSMVTIEVCHG